MYVLYSPQCVNSAAECPLISKVSVDLYISLCSVTMRQVRSRRELRFKCVCVSQRSDEEGRWGAEEQGCKGQLALPE